MGFEIYLLDMVAYIGIYGILAISLNLQYGFTGMANFGVAAFFMIGAYSSALATEAGLPYIASILIAMIISGIIGLLASLPAIKLREDYLAITMLAFGEVCRLVIKNEAWIAGGVWGIYVPPAIRFYDASPAFNMILQLALIFSVLASFYVLAQIIVNSPYGRVMRAIREDELLASTFGKNTFVYKAQIFTLGSAFAGAAGSLFAQYNTFIDPFIFVPILTFTVWIMVMTGGPANNLGVVTGAFFVQALERGARIVKDYLVLPIDPHNLRAIIIGLLIILILVYKPKGLLKEGRIKTPALKVKKNERSIVKS
ncbi:MAG: branched-chain amino acid ABC transporter permease [archaeon]|nr:branched-chain amino acid ABC transporter permease [archaeon]MCP8314111.1 branched-chain amino acid ABC transporter permease [archaeon]MCP8316105.1 branched-chain amino acid ABC transporter permease [archaeon]MCP8321306.1 branched-chain amino acid ABC transporter permease [archaeon]